MGDIPGPVQDSTFSRTIAAVPSELAELRSALRSWLQLHRICGIEAIDVILAVGEAAANAIEHAYPPDASGRVDVEVTRHPQELTMSIRDYGRWRAVPARGERGRGLALMRAVSDVEVLPRNAGTTVTMRMSTGTDG